MCLITALLLTTACSDDSDNNSGVKMTDVTVTYKVPDGITPVSVSDLTVRFKNVTTGQTTTATATAGNETGVTATLPEGLYNIDMEGTLVYTIDTVADVTRATDVQVKSQIRASMDNVTITGATFSVPQLQTYLHSVKDGFVFAEIAIGGTLTPSGDTYNGDSYFRITNNTDSTLYADGLVLMESQFTTDDKQDYKPNVMPQAFTVGTAYMVPGNGTDYPVKPGESIIICDQAIDHTKINPKSFDLTKADFEWYDGANDPESDDIDNPDVPNLIPLYSHDGPGMWQPKQGGNCAYAIGFLGDGNNSMTSKEYLSQYKYTYFWKFVYGEFEMDKSEAAYMFPNSWIADAVNMYPKDEGNVWLVVDPSLDKGYASIASTSSSDDHYGSCIRRKYDATKKKLVDTNDSSSDFLMIQQANPWYEFK